MALKGRSPSSFASMTPSLPMMSVQARESSRPKPPPLGKQLSPLRYPGSKRQLLPWIVELLRLNAPQPKTFVEPFAGGASVGLYVASAGLADRVVIGDVDPLLYSFWKIATEDSAWLIEAMWNVDVTVENWRKFRARQGSNNKDRAIACLFLNRTSFSGILHHFAGPIGGKEQKSENTIDCRFPKETLDERLQLVGKLGADGKLVARGTSYQQTVSWAASTYGDGQFVYLDPPFWSKAKTLYRRSFETTEHDSLAKWVASLECRWLLSYDPAPEVATKYKSLGHTPKTVQLGYLAAPGRRPVTELVLTSEPCVPATTHEWKDPSS